MFTNTKIALAAALILVSGAAALAGDQGEERGGYVLPDSMDGVNPVYHPDIFGNGSNAFGSVAKPTVQQDRSLSRKPAYSR
jgi:hypothetical protein